MNWIVTIRPKAKADLRHSHDWYDERCVGLVDEFLADHAAAILRLETDPERFPVYYRGFRRVLTHRFPYKIFFASWVGRLSLFASFTVRKTIRMNFAGEALSLQEFSRNGSAR